MDKYRNTRYLIDESVFIMNSRRYADYSYRSFRVTCFLYVLSSGMVIFFMTSKQEFHKKARKFDIIIVFFPNEKHVRKTINRLRNRKCTSLSLYVFLKSPKFAAIFQFSNIPVLHQKRISKMSLQRSSRPEYLTIRMF